MPSCAPRLRAAASPAGAAPLVEQLGLIGALPGGGSEALRAALERCGPLLYPPWRAPEPPPGEAAACLAAAARLLGALEPNASDALAGWAADAHVRDGRLHFARRAIAARLRALPDGTPRATDGAPRAAALLARLGAIEIAAAASRRAPTQLPGAPPPPPPPPPYRRLPALLGALARRGLDATAAALAPDLATADLALVVAPAALAPLLAALALAPSSATTSAALGAALLPRVGAYSGAPQRPVALAAGARFHAAARLAPHCAHLHMKAAAVAMRARGLVGTDTARADAADGDAPGASRDAQLVSLFAAAVAADPASLPASQHLVTALRWAGDDAAAAAEARRAVARGMWARPAQRPAMYTRGLTARARWAVDDAAPGLCAAVRLSIRAVAAEAHALLGSADGCGTQEEGIHTDNSSWATCDVLSRCRARDPRVAAACTALQGGTDGGGRARGLAWPRVLSAQFSALGGGAHVRPHTGSTNRRLVVHVTLGGGGGAAMRVGSGPWAAFEADGCVAFDDSFEHEVYHPGTAPRINLVVQVLHPELH